MSCCPLAASAAARGLPESRQRDAFAAAASHEAHPGTCLSVHPRDPRTAEYAALCLNGTLLPMLLATNASAHLEILEKLHEYKPIAGLVVTAAHTN